MCIAHLHEGLKYAISYTKINLKVHFLSTCIQLELLYTNVYAAFYLLHDYDDHITLYIL